MEGREWLAYQLHEVSGGEGENVGAGDDARAPALHGGLGHLHRVEAVLRQVLVLLHVPLHHRPMSPRLGCGRSDQDGRVAALHILMSRYIH